MQCKWGKKLHKTKHNKNLNATYTVPTSFELIWSEHAHIDIHHLQISYVILTLTFAHEWDMCKQMRKHYHTGCNTIANC